MLLGASCAFAGCGSGGTGEERRAAALPDIALPEPEPQALPPSPATACIELHDGSCTSKEDFDDRAHALAETYAAHDQFGNQWGLAAIGADRAYAHVDLLRGEPVAPGAGVTIGFLDSGIDQFHPMFTGTRVTEVLMSGAVDEPGDESSHGTAVASVAAATRDLPSPLVPHGVAWGADIAMFAIPLGAGDGTYTPVSLDDLASTDAGSAQEFRQVLTWPGRPPARRHPQSQPGLPGHHRRLQRGRSSRQHPGDHRGPGAGRSGREGDPRLGGGQRQRKYL